MLGERGASVVVLMLACGACVPTTRKTSKEITTERWTRALGSPEPRYEVVGIRRSPAREDELEIELHPAECVERVVRGESRTRVEDYQVDEGRLAAEIACVVVLSAGAVGAGHAFSQSKAPNPPGDNSAPLKEGIVIGMAGGAIGCSIPLSVGAYRLASYPREIGPRKIERLVKTKTVCDPEVSVVLERGAPVRARRTAPGRFAAKISPTMRDAAESISLAVTIDGQEAHRGQLDP